MQSVYLILKIDDHVTPTCLLDNSSNTANGFVDHMKF